MTPAMEADRLVDGGGAAARTAATLPAASY